MIKLKRLTFLIIVIQISSLISGDLKIPERIDENWAISEPKRIFIGNKLFDHINGAAELFLEYGFKDLTVCKYSNDSVTVELEVYKMDNVLAALGIYLMKTGTETPLKDIAVRNSANPFQIVLTSGQYFILVNNFSGHKNYTPFMIHLCNKVVEQIESTDIDDLFTYLPKDNMIKESQKLFCGPYGLQSIYTFGNGDILLLGGKIFGVGADYKSKSKEATTRLVIPYPDSNAAMIAFQNLRSNLDPYLKILDTLDNHFIFKDYNQKFGLVRIQKNQILIQLHLFSKPE